MSTKPKYELGHPAPGAEDDGTRYNANHVFNIETGRCVATFQTLPGNRTLLELETLATRRPHTRGDVNEAKAAVAAMNSAEALAAALRQALAYVTRVQSHDSNMSVEEIKAAEAEFTETVSQISIGHHGGEGPTFDLAAARAALEAYGA